MIADSLQELLSRVQIPALVLGIDSDVLYPLTEQEELAEASGKCEGILSVSIA